MLTLITITLAILSVNFLLHVYQINKLKRQVIAVSTLLMAIINTSNELRQKLELSDEE